MTHDPTTSDIEPLDADLFESLHRAEWIAEKASSREYGRLLKLWMDDQGDGIIRDWYLHKIDQAPKISSSNPSWEALGLLLQSRGRERELELFRLVAGMDGHPVALDESGQWRVELHVAVSILKRSIERIEQESSDRKNFLYILAVGLLIAVISRFA